MSSEILGFIGIAAAFLMIALGVPIAMALGGIGVIGLLYITGFVPTLSQITLTNWVMSTSITMACIPLFVFMGEAVFHAGIASDLYSTTYKWFGHLPGGLAIASSFSCAAFGSVCGSSVATVGTIGSIAVPEMKKYGYDTKLATGCLSASGTMGAMIPPSIQLIIYGVLTEESIGRLFMGGVMPGILEAITYSMMILLLCWHNPTLGPRAPKFPWREKLASLSLVVPILVLFILVLGGIYVGIFTPTEASGVGAFIALVITVSMRRMSLRRFWAALSDTGRITAMVMALIVGGLLFSRFLVLTGVAPALIDFVMSFEVSPYVTLIGICLMYVLLGMILNVTTMLILTIPLIYPIIIGLGFDGIWFGIIAIKMCEVAAITPPIGANVYVMKVVAPDVPIETIFRGIIPFVLMDFVNTILLIAFPLIVLFIPNMMF